ncbi:helix-turn-helix domain-containing protein [Streptomyces sp. NPDC057620]|uniref:AlbA family DNA-binding domain-containing protein n=1 Tax=Streptomyces sp. NPDC057620 TaxID=3346185 RepID=UPI00367CE883
MSYYRRLATLLGSDPAQATADDVRRLLKNPQAAEDQDLDYKLTAHDTGTAGGGELAKDIAAFANATGGVLILGLQEDRKTSIPVHAAPLPLPDGLRRRFLETLASRTAPIVDCQIHYAKEAPAAGGQAPTGFALVMVPPSPRAPHAVTGLNDSKDGTLRFPVRSGSATRFMTPSEVETAFFDKQNRRAQREERHEQLLAAIVKEGEINSAKRFLAFVKKARLVLTLVPHSPGDMAWDQQVFKRYQQQVRAELSLVGESHTTFDTVEPAPFGFVARQDQGSVRQVTAVFADDGSSAVEYPLSVETSRGALYDDDDDFSGAVMVSSGDLTMTVVSALGLLSRHAVDRAGAMGGCSIRAELTGPLTREPATDSASAAPRPLLLTSASMQWASTSRAAQSGAVEIGTFVEDLVQPGKALIQAADLLMTRLGRQFGQVESVYTTRDGTLVRGGRFPDFPPGVFYDWANGKGLDVQERVN